MGAPPKGQTLLQVHHEGVVSLLVGEMLDDLGSQELLDLWIGIALVGGYRPSELTLPDCLNPMYSPLLVKNSTVSVNFP